jgi:hypothetical protein
MMKWKQRTEMYLPDSKHMLVAYEVWLLQEFLLGMDKFGCRLNFVENYICSLKPVKPEMR